MILIRLAELPQVPLLQREPTGCIMAVRMQQRCWMGTARGGSIAEAQPASRCQIKGDDRVTTVGMQALSLMAAAHQPPATGLSAGGCWQMVEQRFGPR